FVAFGGFEVSKAASLRIETASEVSGFPFDSLRGGMEERIGWGGLGIFRGGAPEAFKDTAPAALMGLGRAESFITRGR
ncbi:hypothetical protein N9A86_01180, partial [Akkermansiaceae bacterium]|nr:hypothetical protein [Akkermansiaceae bacterium]